ncbi:MAG: 4-hydroxy-tetrahydrodipicolinate reductase [Acidimicrobiales bacterium]
MTTVGVLGARGRMGQTVCEAVEGADDLVLGPQVDLGDPLDDLAGSEVVVVFTAAGQAMDGLRWCAANGVHAVVGTTGFSDEDVAELRGLFSGPPNLALVANFAIGAVLLMQLAERCAPHFATCEITEMHHDLKVDAPSGTAVATARRIAAARNGEAWAPDPTTTEVVAGARGGVVEGIHLHSQRQRGMVASQEVVLGTEGQWLTLRHDTSSRQSFMPGVLLAVRGIGDRPGVTLDLDPFL